MILCKRLAAEIEGLQEKKKRGATHNEIVAKFVIIKPNPAITKMILGGGQRL